MISAVTKTTATRTTSLSDGITSFNQTNLVLKGIIGISAMSFISSANGEIHDEMVYQVHLLSLLVYCLDIGSNMFSILGGRTTISTDMA